MSTMTLKETRSTLASWLGGSEACLDARNVETLSAMISSIDANLAQPAQAVDVGAIREVIETMRERRGLGMPRLADTLTRAIGNAQAEGWKVPEVLCERNPAPNAAAAVGMTSATHMVYLSGELSAPAPPQPEE